jgi:5-methyltetrahydrofolate--homocysteine methyltransferase
MRSSLVDLLAQREVLLADGATGTNYFAAGLPAGHPPELWNVEQPEKVMDLHQRFVDAGADIILTNSFGGTCYRLKLHQSEDRVFELAQRAAQLARRVADAAPRPVVVGGSVGPTGELFEPLGALTHADAVAAFREQMEGLIAGGVDVIWIETLSSAEEIRAAAEAAISIGAPYVCTCSFDTAGRTMMGLLPNALGAVFADLPVAPLAYGANCGVGASDMLVTVKSMCSVDHGPVVAKGNCGIPQFRGAEIVYSGTPELMATYARLAADAGARIVGGCCGTSPAHLAAMRRALDARVPAPSPSVEEIVAQVGPLTNALPSAGGEGRARRRRSESSSE